MILVAASFVAMLMVFYCQIKMKHASKHEGISETIYWGVEAIIFALVFFYCLIQL